MALLINLTLDSCAYENDTITKQKNVLLNLNALFKDLVDI